MILIIVNGLSSIGNALIALAEEVRFKIKHGVKKAISLVGGGSSVMVRSHGLLTKPSDNVNVERSVRLSAIISEQIDTNSLNYY